MHGISGSNSDWNKAMKWIEQYHPGTQTFSVDCYNGAFSWSPMHPQVECLAGAIENIQEHYGVEDYILMCHSQGALLCRAFLMMYEHKGAYRYLSLSGPHSGQYGIPEVDTYIPKVLRNLTVDACSALCYMNKFQETISFCQYWRDSRSFEKYIDSSAFLAPLNNESTNPSSEEYKTNFLSLQEKVILFGSNGDKVITPYNSAFFGFYKDGSDLHLDTMEHQKFYENDWFGLKTLNERGDLVMVNLDDVYHTDWIWDETVFTTHVLPYLE